MLVLEQRSDVPVGFTKGLAAPAANILDLRLAIKQNNIAGLEKALFDVSTPGSALYGQHLSKEEVHHLHLLRAPILTYPKMKILRWKNLLRQHLRLFP